MLETNSYIDIQNENSSQENLSNSQNKWFTKSANHLTLPTQYSLRIQYPDITRGWRRHLTDSKSFDNIGRVPWSQKET